MKYFIQRELNEYGPYTLADLQRYVAQGNIQLTDLTRSEGMTEWVAVSQVIGNIPAPGVPPIPQPPMAQAGVQANAQPNVQYAAQPVAPAAGTVYGGGTTYSGTGTVYENAAPAYGGHTLSGQLNAFVPPDFHWALVLLISVFTCGLFSYVWIIVEAAFSKKLKPESNAFLLVILGVVGIFAGSFIGGVVNAVQRETSPVTGLFWLAGLVVYVIGIFKIKSDLEEYYNSVEPINLQLSGVMTFFFNVFYFQHHYSRIARWKKTGILVPQG